MRYVIIALIGALASVLSNQGIAVFNDGFRPIVGQYFNKEIIDDLKKLGTKEVQNAYKNMLAWRFAAATLIPMCYICKSIPIYIFIENILHYLCCFFIYN